MRPKPASSARNWHGKFEVVGFWQRPMASLAPRKSGKGAIGFGCCRITPSDSSRLLPGRVHLVRPFGRQKHEDGRQKHERFHHGRRHTQASGHCVARFRAFDDRSSRATAFHRARVFRIRSRNSIPAPVAAANYNRPKPVDPIWYRRDCYIRIHCGCGRTVVETLGRFVEGRGLPSSLLLHELIARLRCGACGRRPSADVTRYRNGN